jgi:hypothetical protein
MKTLSKEAAELLLTISNNEELQAFAKELYPELGKKELPKRWEKLPEIEGWYFDNHSNIDNVVNAMSKREKQDLADELYDEGFIARKDDRLNDEFLTGFDKEAFKLIGHSHRLSLEDEQTILRICEKIII